jgi:hypothetical protein
MLLLHWPVQQSMGEPHVDPSGKHWEKPQTNVFGSQNPLQHSKPVVQGKPSGEHIGLMHDPNSQTFEQHSALVLHGKLLGKQLPMPQVLVSGSQAPEQQSKSLMQKMPSGWQKKPQLKVFGSQNPLQHWKSALHENPSGKQPPKPHEFVAKSQLPLQHENGSVQNAPSG